MYVVDLVFETSICNECQEQQAAPKPRDKTVKSESKNNDANSTERSKEVKHEDPGWSSKVLD
jgi:hypothetical protein